MSEANNTVASCVLSPSSAMKTLAKTTDNDLWVAHLVYQKNCLADDFTPLRELLLDGD